MPPGLCLDSTKYKVYVLFLKTAYRKPKLLSLISKYLLLHRFACRNMKRFVPLHNRFPFFSNNILSRKNVYSLSTAADFIWVEIIHVNKLPVKVAYISIHLFRIFKMLEIRKNDMIWTDCKQKIQNMIPWSNKITCFSVISSNAIEQDANWYLECTFGAII